MFMLGAHDCSSRLITCFRSAPCSPSSWLLSSIQLCAHAGTLKMSNRYHFASNLTSVFAGAQSSSRKRFRLRRQTRQEAEWQKQEDKGSPRLGCPALTCLHNRIAQLFFLLDRVPSCNKTARTSCGMSWVVCSRSRAPKRLFFSKRRRIIANTGRAAATHRSDMLMRGLKHAACCLCNG
jgi:hypothetical protein